MFIPIFINEEKKIIVDNSDIKLIIKDNRLYKIILKDGGIYNISKKEFERLELLLTSDFDEMLKRFEDLKKMNEEMDGSYYEKRDARKKI
jgi:hypothetical protein